MKRAHGFTIVELLVVIVVIAILAAITLVSYNGIRNRAYNTNTVESASQWLKVLAASYTLNGTQDIHKSKPGDNMVCLGTKEQYPAISSDLRAGQCYVYAHTSDDLEVAIAEIGAVSMQMRVVQNDDYDSRGIQYWVWYDSPTDPIAYMEYALVGEGKDCVLSNTESISEDGVTFCELNVSESIGGIPFDLD